MVVAHRGASVEQPENTIEAFEAAIDAGADAVEFDVRMTADGHAVVMHDPDVSRTTRGRGLVSEMTLEELRKLGVPTVEDALKCLSGRAAADIEIKNLPGEPGFTTERERAVDATLAALDSVGFAGQVTVSSFNPASIAYSRRVRPDVPTGLLTSYNVEADEARRRAAADGHPWVLPFVLKVLEAGDGFSDRVHAGGALLGVWLADDPETARRLFELGVDAVATNDPRAIAEVRPGRRRYDRSDLQVLTAIGFVARMEARFFPSGHFSPEQAIEYIQDEAQVLGIPVVSEEVDGWWLVSASRDWLPQGEKTLRAFHELLQFPEAGINAHRCEVFLTTFAKVVLTSKRGEVTVIKDESGDASQAVDRFSEVFDEHTRVIAFLP
jgi:glycerophosphoryl diester phosphodiesterase